MAELIDHLRAHMNITGQNHQICKRRIQAIDPNVIREALVQILQMQVRGKMNQHTCVSLQSAGVADRPECGKP